MSDTPRPHHAAEQKVAAVKRHLIDKVPVSQVCDELRISVNTFFLWQKELFENGHRAFERNGRRAHRAEEQRQKQVDALEARLQKKDGVIARLMEEHVELKKSLGEP
jgi:transposase-like protein